MAKKKKAEAPEEKMLADLERIKDSLRITKVTASRSIKKPGGDTFVSFTAQWGVESDSHNDDLNPDQETDTANNGMTFRDSSLASYMVSMRADVQAWESALAGGMVTRDQCAEAVRNIKGNYNILIKRLYGLSD